MLCNIALFGPSFRISLSAGAGENQRRNWQQFSYLLCIIPFNSLHFDIKTYFPINHLSFWTRKIIEERNPVLSGYYLVTLAWPWVVIIVMDYGSDQVCKHSTVQFLCTLGLAIRNNNRVLILLYILLCKLFAKRKRILNKESKGRCVHKKIIV